MSVTDWHASPQRAVLPLGDPTTGEVRVPVALYDLDELQAEVPLVLSRTEAEQLRDSLDTLLAGTLVPVPLGASGEAPRPDEPRSRSRVPHAPAPHHRLRPLQREQALPPSGRPLPEVEGSATPMICVDCDNPRPRGARLRWRQHVRGPPRRPGTPARVTGLQAPDAPQKSATPGPGPPGQIGSARVQTSRQPGGGGLPVRSLTTTPKMPVKAEQAHSDAPSSRPRPSRCSSASVTEHRIRRRPPTRPLDCETSIKFEAPFESS